MFSSDADLSRRLDAVAAEYAAARCSGPGNPMQTQILRRHGVLATKVPFAPGNPFFNRVTALEDPADLDFVLEFYRATQQSCWVEVPPYHSAEVVVALIKAGFTPWKWSSMLCAAPVPMPLSTQVDVGRIESVDRDLFLDTMNVGFDTPIESLGDLRRNQSFWCDVPDWHLFLARVGGEAAGAAVMSVHGEIGYLAAGSALPRFRGRGVHTALISARLTKARELGLSMVCGQADFGSQSQRNQQRAGLEMVHTKWIWSNCP